MSKRQPAVRGVPLRRPTGVSRAGARRFLRAHVPDLAALAWYVLLTAVYLWPLLAQMDSAVPRLRQDPSGEAAVLASASDNLLRLDFGHLYAGSFFYAASEQSNALLLGDALMGLQPIALPLRVLTNDALLTLNLLVVLTFPLTAGCADLLARLLTRSRLAGVVAGTVFAFAAYRFTHVIHINLLNTWVIPLSFYLLERSLRGATLRWRVAWAASLAVTASLSLHYCLFLFITEPVYVVARLAVAGDRGALARRLPGLVLPAALAATGVAVFAAPYLAMAGDGYTRTAYQTWQFSAHVTDYLAPAADSLAAHPLFDATAPLAGFDEREISPGLIAMALAFGGVAYAAARRRGEWLRAALPWLLVVGVAFVLSLGPELWPSTRYPPTGNYPRLPYSYLSHVLPLAGLRAPARFGVLVLLGVAVLAAVTAAAMQRRLERRVAAMSEPAPTRPDSVARQDHRAGLRARPALLVAGLSCVLVAGLALEYSVALTVDPIPWGGDRPAVYTWLRTAEPGPVVELPTDSVSAGTYALYSTYDGHPRLNGWSGFTPVVSRAVNVYDVSTLDVPSWLVSCRELGARYLVVHRDEVAPDVLDEIESAARAGKIERVAAFARDEVFVFP